MRRMRQRTATYCSRPVGVGNKRSDFSREENNEKISSLGSTI